MLELDGFGWMLWRGLAVTLAVGACAFAAALGFGLLGAWGKLSGGGIARAAAGAYTTIIRGVPELLLLLIVFYGAPTLIQDLAAARGLEIVVDLDPFTAGALTLGFVYGAFAAEVFRGAFLAVPRGEIEAGRALGMSRSLAFRRVVLPRTLRFALPGLGNVWMVLVKATALVSVIQLDELMRMAHVGMVATKLPFNFFLAAALMYLGLALLSSLGQRRVERWAARGAGSA